jgi:hypothetical protein
MPSNKSSSMNSHYQTLALKLEEDECSSLSSFTTANKNKKRWLWTMRLLIIVLSLGKQLERWWVATLFEEKEWWGVAMLLLVITWCLPKNLKTTMNLSSYFTPDPKKKMTTNNAIARCHFFSWKRTGTMTSSNATHCHYLCFPRSWKKKKKMTMSSAIALCCSFFWKRTRMTISSSAGHCHSFILA